MKQWMVVGFWLLSSLAVAGGRAGNGFAVPCRESQADGLAEGYYSLDYLVTLGLGKSREVRSWEESAARIKKILTGVLSQSQMALFDDFVSNVRNTEDYSRQRVWEPSLFGVVNLKTQIAVDNPGNLPLHNEQIKSNLTSLVSKLPQSCQTASGDVELVPAVVFQDHFFTGRPEGYLVYKFVPKILNELEVNDPLQLSYLYVHEWLWDISNNEDRNRRLNQLLHSERVEKMTKAQIRQQFSGMGLALGDPSEVSPVLTSADLAEAYELTKIPASKLSFSEIQQKILKGQPYAEIGRYHLFALGRTCESPDDCTPWRHSPAIWKDIVKTWSVPKEGRIHLRNEANLLILAKSDPVSLDRGPKQKIETECKVDHSDSLPYSAACRRLWVPEGAMEPLGYLYVNGLTDELHAYFTDTSLWIGAQMKRGKEEMRVALVAPYDQKTFLSRPAEPESNWLTAGDSTLANGRIRRVIEIPPHQLPMKGKFASATQYHYDTQLELRGTLRGLRAYARYDDTLENIAVQAIAPRGGKYGYGGDATTEADCEAPYLPARSCQIEMKMGFAVAEASGPWSFDFNFYPHSLTNIQGLQIVFEVDPNS
jgi:hypothetical protein